MLRRVGVEYYTAATVQARDRTDPPARWKRPSQRAPRSFLTRRARSATLFARPRLVALSLSQYLQIETHTLGWTLARTTTGTVSCRQ